MRTSGKSFPKKTQEIILPTKGKTLFLDDLYDGITLQEKEKIVS